MGSSDHGVPSTDGRKQKRKRRGKLLIPASAALLLLACALLPVRRSQSTAGRLGQEIDVQFERLSQLMRQMDASAIISEEPAEPFYASDAEDIKSSADGEANAEALSQKPLQAPAQNALAFLRDTAKEFIERLVQTALEQKHFPIPAGHRMIFAGDSRTVGMKSAQEETGDPCIYIGMSGEGYTWLIEEGIPQIDAAIRAYPSSPVIYNFGVNDCGQIASYLSVYREMELAYPDTDFYYMSVNPVTEESVNVPLSDVLAFNRKLKAAFPDRYIDSCTWMLRYGFEDVDGVHYSERQYRLIHDFAVHAVLQMQKENTDTAAGAAPVSRPEALTTEIQTG